MAERQRIALSSRSFPTRRRPCRPTPWSNGTTMPEPVRILHTADWHLGKRLRDFPLLEEQAAVVDQVLGIAEHARPDALVIAGDVFDVAVPSVEALAVWSAALDRLVDLGIPVLVIPGNHDQAERLAYLAAISARAGVHVRAHLRDVTTPLVVKDAAIYGLPFTRPVRVRSAFELGTDLVPDGDDAAAMRHLARIVLEGHAREHPALRPVAVAHCFVDGAGPEDDGEDAICVGGAGAISADVFDGFAYVALGHLHGRRNLGRGRVRYAGSLFPTSFAEAGHEKSVSLVTLDGDDPSVEEFALRAPRRVRVIDGYAFDDVLVRAADESDDEREAFVLVRVTDVEPIDSAHARLRAFYPRSLLEHASPDGGPGAFEHGADVHTLDPRSVAIEFLRERTGQDPSDLYLDVLDAALAYVPEEPE
jgi:DNA repair protein SbcD/Mre11